VLQKDETQNRYSRLFVYSQPWLPPLFDSIGSKHDYRSQLALGANVSCSIFVLACGAAAPAIKFAT